MEVSTFVCSICEAPSQSICVYCTKDACDNHLCDRCHRCSDCCVCEVRIAEPEVVHHSNGHVHGVAVVESEPEG